MAAFRLIEIHLSTHLSIRAPVLHAIVGVASVTMKKED